MAMLEDHVAAHETFPPKEIELGELKTANHLLGDRAKLDDAWQRDGYWFFKGVIDTAVLSEIKGHLMRYLKEKGLIDPEVDDNRYNGASLESKNVTEIGLLRLLHFNRINLDRVFTRNPSVDGFIKHVLGDAPFWLPQTDFRAIPPLGDPNESRLTYPHQDGFYTPGIDMKTCWLPLDTIDPELGGCAWLEGLHNGPTLHTRCDPPDYRLREIPTKGWKTSTFEPGDIVIFHWNLPHCGLTNISRDRFRLSFDIRMTKATGNTARVGNIVRLSQTQVAIIDRDTGEEQSFEITDDTYVKDNSVMRKIGAEIPASFAIGDTVLVGAREDHQATTLSPIH